MRLRVSHATLYRYDAPVFLEQQVIRLKPRDDGSVRLLSYELEVLPRPSTMSAGLDAEGNHVLNVWFTELTDRFHVRTAFVVEMLRRNPFDFLLSDMSLASLPLQYPPGLAEQLMPYRAQPEDHSRIYELAKSVAVEVGWSTLPFLSALTRRIYDTVEHTIREKGEPQRPIETLLQRRGACRDVAVLFIAACRCMGIAARFVSGYETGAARLEKSYMHAWAEVYLPGGGWRGYDPSRGLAVAMHHIPVAAGVEPAAAAAISGNYRGTGIGSHMDFTILMDEETGEATTESEQW